ncbi:hypothetical protein M3P05_08165 [Sansalvadorimonas sp. 2012CJ34-2]|uniref:Uncharacterized protein n=1 Tax=Parendozoicomonas callyspongiae TaxID=2942213 RepID=A0ABT0PEW3_9GAMM|nr:hypothetical protein [Sansalvadorimonas sp. 2012CJ34-2]MCL6269910.1 hypothetical protein [Sansalvadorimonas sp. 2012CJ34-2]
MKKKCLRREPADHFRTRRVSLEQTVDGWNIQPVGQALTFSELQALRQTGKIERKGNTQIFANLGVSLQLVIKHKDRKALALVQQRDILKLVSGYVPEDQLDNPLQTAWAELMEEVLSVSDKGLFGFSVAEEVLPDPYQLQRQNWLPVLKAPFIGSLSEENLTFSGRSTEWPVNFYIHHETASLQLVFPVTIEVPDDVTLIHAEDEISESGQEVLSIFDPECPAILMELDQHSMPTGKLFTLNSGEWTLWKPGQAKLSEYFSGPGKQLSRHFLD